MQNLTFADLLTFVCADCGELYDTVIEEDAAEQHDLGRPGHDFIAAPPENVDTPDEAKQLAQSTSAVL